MRDSRWVVKRYEIRCDVCGKVETREVRNERAVVESTSITDWSNDWQMMPSHGFSTDAVDVCSRECAEREAARLVSYAYDSRLLEAI